MGGPENLSTWAGAQPGSVWEGRRSRFGTRVARDTQRRYMRDIFSSSIRECCCLVDQGSCVHPGSPMKRHLLLVDRFLKNCCPAVVPAPVREVLLSPGSEWTGCTHQWVLRGQATPVVLYTACPQQPCAQKRHILGAREWGNCRLIQVPVEMVRTLPAASKRCSSDETTSLNSMSALHRFSTVLTACMTVVWSRPPK